MAVQIVVSPAKRRADGATPHLRFEHIIVPLHRLQILDEVMPYLEKAVAPGSKVTFLLRSDCSCYSSLLFDPTSISSDTAIRRKNPISQGCDFGQANELWEKKLKDAFLLFSIKGITSEIRSYKGHLLGAIESFYCQVWRSAVVTPVNYSLGLVKIVDKVAIPVSHFGKRKFPDVVLIRGGDPEAKVRESNPTTCLSKDDMGRRAPGIHLRSKATSAWR